MRAASLAALGLAAYSAFLVATIPAGYVAAQVQSSMPGKFQVSDAQGTIWRGSARVRVGQIGPTLDRVEWKIVPARLLSGELAFRVHATGEGLGGDFEAARGLQNAIVRGLKVQGDARGITGFVPALGAWHPSGNIEIAVPEMTIKGREPNGEAQVEWRGAITTLSDVRPLGSYRATWKGEGGQGKIVVTTLQGPLRVTGEGTTSATRFAFRGEARGEGESAKALEPLLDLIGPRRPDGARTIDVRMQ